MKGPLEALDETKRLALERMDQGYKTWLEKLTTLSLTALTLLVSLQNTYVPRSPRAGWLLAVVWSLLAVAVLAGLLALFGEARSHRLFLLRIKDQLLPKLEPHRATWGRDPDQDRVKMIQAIDQIPYGRPKLYLAAAATAAGGLALAVISLAAFAIVNLP